MRRLSRRELLQLAQVGGVGACAAGLGLLGTREANAATTHGTCRICTMQCGLTAETRGGAIHKVQGDLQSKTRGFICHHGHALREIVHSPHRLRRPLKRVNGELREADWAEVLPEIGEKLLALRAEFGAQTLAVQTGWPFVRHPLIHLLHRFCQAFGTPNLATVASLCEASAREARCLTAGSNLRPDLKRTRTLLVWGANPPISAPPFAHLVRRMGEHDRTLIVVDPTRTELADAATLHLQPRPGTDGALALSLAQVILAEGLHDAAYLAENALGLDEYRALVQQFPPSRGEELTGVPAARIVEAARLFAKSGPAATWEGLGIEHHEGGVQTVRAVLALSVLCGYVDVPGGSELMTKPGDRFWDEPLPALYRMATADPVPPPVTASPIGREEFPVHHVYNRQAQAMRFADAMLEDRPYPLRALILVGSNAFYTSPAAAGLRAARERLGLLVVIDPFLSGSGQLADYVLPACTFAESPSVGPGEEDAEVARSALVPPQHQSWQDSRILFELARAAGMEKYFPWKTFREALDAPRKPYMSDPEHELRPAVSDGAKPPRFPTPSGKLELASSVLARFGYPALPEWTAPSEVPSKDFPFHLVTGPRTHAYVNSQFREVPSLKREAPEPVVLVHPETARSLGLVEGELAEVTSPHGKVTMKAHLTDRVRPDTVVVPAGWERVGANELTSGDRLDPISGFPALRSGVCQLRGQASAL